MSRHRTRIRKRGDAWAGECLVCLDAGRDGEWSADTWVEALAIGLEHSALSVTFGAYASPARWFEFLS